MEAFFAGHGVPFKTRVFDLGMMNYQLMGGSVERKDGPRRALFVYRAPGNQKLVCEMYEGRIETLPKGATLRQNKGVAFYVYETGEMTAVFWPEGAVICALVSDIKPEEVVQLAFAKAMP
jgi:hypothetical protein